MRHNLGDNKWSVSVLWDKIGMAVAEAPAHPSKESFVVHEGLTMVGTSTGLVGHVRAPHANDQTIVVMQRQPTAP